MGFIEEHFTLWVIAYIIMLFFSYSLKEFLPDTEDPKHVTITETFIPKNFFFSIHYGYGILTLYCITINILFIFILINMMDFAVKNYLPEFPTDWFADVFNI